jgi:hypothetical protein
MIKYLERFIMKKVIIYLFIAVAVCFFITPACKKSSDDAPGTPVDSIPTLALNAGTGFISRDTTVQRGSAITFGIAALSSGTHSPLTHFLVTRTFANKPNTVIDSTFSSTSFDRTVSDFANSEAGPETWVFRITDQLNKYKEVHIVITTTNK